MHPPSPDLPMAPTPPDTQAYALLGLPVAWADSRGRLQGSNPAFEAATGHTAAAAHGRALAEVLGLAPAGSATGLSDLLASGTAFPPLPFAGRDASGQPLAGLLSLAGQADLRVLTLQLSAAPLLSHEPWRFWDLRPAAMTAPGAKNVTHDAATQAATETFTEAPTAANRTAPPAATTTIDATHAGFEMAITLAGIGIWQHQAGTGLLKCNHQGWSLLGLPAQRHGRPLSSLLALLHPEDQASILHQLSEAQSGGPSVGPVELGARCRHRDGRWRYLLTRRVARLDTNGHLLGHVGVVLDLSDHYEQQQLALGLAQRLEMATAAAGVGIWGLQLGQPQVTHWDEQMRALHGLGADAEPPRLSDYIANLVLETDRASVAEGMATLMQRREGLLDLDLRIVRPDGRVRRLATRTSISGADGQRQLHGVMLDVTERHSTEDQLRQANERAALAARGAGIGTWESDALALAGWWDEQMFRLRGRAPMHGPVPIELMLSWLHPEDREVYSVNVGAALRDDAPTHSEFRVVLPDGSHRWLASRSTPVRDEHGTTVRRIGINWDITDVRNAAQVREERALVQRESQAKSRFLARISHELRTPLNAVLGFSQLLLAEQGPPDPSTWRRRVEHVQASGEHLLALIDDVLELSSLESGELPLSLQPVALAPLAKTSLPLVELLAIEHGVSLHLGALDGWAQADPVRLRQVLLNLLSNAIKYNRPGGSVTVSARADAGWLLLQVEDTGRGLDADQISHLFEPFNRLGQEREGIAGTGIGLAIVQASVQHMGGAVRVHSELGKGSCFEISLQQASAPTAVDLLAHSTADLAVNPVAGFADDLANTQLSAGTAAAPGTPSPACSGRLLYIEDNEVNLLIVRELVSRRSDIEFLSAVDGTSGLAAARAQQPALILLDMQLPDMDGFEVLRRLRGDPATAEIRCIALSANAMPEDIGRAREAGIDDYWTKPLDLRAFMRSIDQLFGAAPA